MEGFVIEKTTVEQLLDLRFLVLRPFVQGPQLCYLEGDKESTSLHYALKAKEEVVGAVSFHLRSQDTPISLQLRAMAIHPSLQSKGTGHFFLSEILEKRLEKDLGTKMPPLWCFAREKAFSFYERLGFEAEGELFEIDRIGTHQKMNYKNTR